MRNFKLLTSAMLLINISFSICTTTLAQTNIALTATTSTSYVSSWETLSAVNNNSNPANSNDKSSGAYGNWNHPNTLDWVQYDWTSSYTISKTEVYWFDDNGGVLTPTTAYVEYWNGSSWVNCGAIPKVKNSWNVLNISSVTTSRFRIFMLNTTQSTGILEWRVWGTSCAPSPVTAYLQINGGSWSQTASASVSVGNSVKFGPQPASGGSWSWSGPNSFKATTREVTISNIQSNQAGTYAATYTNSCGAKTLQNFTVTVTGSDMQAPTTPGTPTASNITSSSCMLTWTASTDNVGVTGYQVLRNGTSIITVTGTTANVTGLSASTTYSFTIKAYDAAGNYSAASGARSVTTSSVSTVGDAYTWPSYSPNISYNFKDEYGTIPTPTNVLNDCSGVVGTTSSEWWCFRWGATKNSLVTSAAINPMLTRFNKDFAYFRDVMGWPPDSRARNGNRSAIYLYGSGLCTDNASNTELGGWQSDVGGNPIVLASYYPVYSYDPACTYGDKESQKSAMIHEGIHCMLASMPGCRDAAWFHEGGNTWLQQEAYSTLYPSSGGMGDLNGCTFLAPFMPIECYSGWLQDGSFGGPAAEGVNQYNSNGQQLCTWRTYLGGNQYGNGFPTFLGTVLGVQSVAWIWKNCPSRVLEGMAAGLGATQLRRLICEYRAKQALLDMGKWSNGFRALLDAHFGQSIGAEWQPSWLNPEAWIATPYAKTTNNGGGLLTPETRTLPGWTGANQIPLTVSGSSVSVNFQPIGANMTCQICYRATDGSAVYSQVVSSGNCTLNLIKAPANNVVIVVICNTDYVYNGESTRTAHYDYRLQIGTGVTGTASVNTKWYATTTAATLKSASINTEMFDISRYCSHSYHAKNIAGTANNNLDRANESDVNIFPNPVSMNSELSIEFNSEDENGLVEITDLQGKTVYSSNRTISGEVKINTAGLLKQGVYLVTVKKDGQRKTYKLLVQ